MTTNHNAPAMVDHPHSHGELIQTRLRDIGAPPFRDSWEAEAYAIGNLLVSDGHLDARHWMDLMASAIKEAQAFGDPDCGDTYYHHCCRALEQYCFESGFIDPTTLGNLISLWEEAIHRTPHGVALAIENAQLSEVSPHHGDGHHDTGHSHSHHHSHHRPEQPPSTYYTPIAKQALQ